MVDDNNNLALIEGAENTEKKTAELPLEYLLLIALVKTLVKVDEHPNHNIVGLRAYVKAHRHDGTVEEVIRAYYETDPEAEAKAEAERKAEREAKKAARAERKAKKDAEIIAMANAQGIFNF